MKRVQGIFLYITGIAIISAFLLVIDMVIMHKQFSFDTVYAFFRFILREPIVSLAFFAISLGTLHIFASRSRWLKITMMGLHFISIGFLFAFFLIQGRGPLPVDTNVVLDGLGDLWFLPVETISAFPHEILFAMLISVVVIFSLSLIGKKIVALGAIFPRSSIAALLYLGFCFLMLLPPYRPHHIDLPVSVRLPLNCLSWLRRDKLLYRGLRNKPLPIQVAASGSPQHILYIVDESVAGKYLQINGYQYSTTPFLSSIQDRFFNYGQASSTANLSMTSNILLVSGLRLDQIPDEQYLSLRQASIFSYASQAGRKPYYVDAQRQAKGNFIYPRDKLDFTYILPYEDDKIFNRDILAIKQIKSIYQNTDEPTFIYLLKMGIHFDHGNKFPPDFSPDLPSSEKVSAEYHRGLKWTVDEFFKALSKELEGLDVLVIYTSDHGQNFEDPSIGLHASTSIAHPGQANVPLIVFPLSETSREWFGKCGGLIPESYNRATAFQIFPTLLTLMGYDKQQTVARFGKSLFDDPYEERVFISGEVFRTTEEDTVRVYFNPFTL